MTLSNKEETKVEDEQPEQEQQESQEPEQQETAEDTEAGSLDETLDLSHESDLSDESNPSDLPNPSVSAESSDETAESTLDDDAEAAVEFEGDRPIVRDLEYQAPRGKAVEEDDEAQNPRFGSIAEAKAVVEGFLFSCNEPLSVSKLSKLMSNLHPKTVRGLLLELQWEYENRPGALQVIEIAGGYQLCTRAFVAPWMFRMHKHKRRSALSPATLETLAIIAYRQPITKGEIETVRGVESGAPLRTLQELNLIEASGRREVIGRPQLYVTTESFLKAFGLKSVGDLPSIAELKSRFAEDTRLKAAVAAPAVEVPEQPVEENPTDPADQPDQGNQDSQDDESDTPEFASSDDLEPYEPGTFEDEQSLDIIAEADDIDDPDEFEDQDDSEEQSSEVEDEEPGS
jgi:segregation and condensation protein B